MSRLHSVVIGKMSIIKQLIEDSETVSKIKENASSSTT